MKSQLWIVVCLVVGSLPAVVEACPLCNARVGDRVVYPAGAPVAGPVHAMPGMTAGAAMSMPLPMMPVVQGPMASSSLGSGIRYSNLPSVYTDSPRRKVYVTRLCIERSSAGTGCPTCSPCSSGNQGSMGRPSVRCYIVYSYLPPPMGVQAALRDLQRGTPRYGTLVDLQAVAPPVKP